MKKLLGVLLSFFLCCVPIGIQAEEELSFEYTGQKIEIDGAVVYWLLDDNIYVSEAPMDCGRYQAIYSDGSHIEYEIIPKVVHVNVRYNKDWRQGDPEENRYLCEYDGDYDFILSSYINGDFKTDYSDNYKFEFEPKNKKDVEIVKTTITHPDVEYVYTGSDIVIESKVDSISPIAFKNVGEYTVSFNVDSNYYESIPFKVTILPKTVQLKLNKFQKYVGEKDPVLETDDYILTREVGEDVGNYKLTAKSKSRNYRYDIIENQMFSIIDKHILNDVNEDVKKQPIITTENISDNNTEINLVKQNEKNKLELQTLSVKTSVFNNRFDYCLLLITSFVISIFMIIFIRK